VPERGLEGADLAPLAIGWVAAPGDLASRGGGPGEGGVAASLAARHPREPDPRAGHRLVVAASGGGPPRRQIAIASFAVAPELFGGGGDYQRELDVGG
jgi:hypothetical protein